MNRIIILNGPPNCGKDTIGEMLIQQTDAATTQFKEVLYKETAKYFDEKHASFFDMKVQLVNAMDK